ncbi:winged helix-turn-helix domain-containing protein [Salisediminibacterium halotolerans]|uniref:winged helix-turn-helix domain-containing protein n=1 Tax=Salisediminibacterium halotolerans TaxID=517425 RepID=UPI000EB59EC3|nr:response regulator transcription factor [Salisediminibacterium halotolerans]RLJ71724.1 two-component system phosphate regulon response regulator PhoB/two-component system response regulator RegX3 [Actinophytocola xinjiangensis]RPE86874.1 two-component system phosphate regulon response regulator PhoB/two-component system response regulator RegX3 [Salisediminibacterium halotolerans]TWG32937.1 two-component system phosphate regulon response regulator PhoB/two-component system response regulator 
MTGNKIAIIEDDEDIRELTALYLENKGYSVVGEGHGDKALALIHQAGPDLILLDMMLPGKSGEELCADISASYDDIPIIIMSSKRSSEDKVRGLNAGANDYITKPFDMAELEARIKANLRRKGAGTAQANHQLRAGDIVIDTESFDVTVAGKPVHLYTKERQLLIYFMQHPGQVFSAEQLYDRIWGEDYFGDLKTVSVHIRNLRKKIEHDPKNPQYVITVRGFGYKFSKKFEFVQEV